MAEKIALAALGWVVSPVVKDLVDKSISYLGSDIAKGLEDLETVLLPQFELTIEAAQHSPHNAKLTRWLARLKNAYFDAEAILHELEYKHLERKAKGKDKKLLVRLSSKPIIKPLAKFANQVKKKASLLFPQKRKLLKRLNKLKAIAAEAKDLRDLLGNNSVIAGNNRSVTSSLLAHKVFGRDGERDHIIKFLLDDGDHDGDRYSVIAITGMGGAGKTTLAQYIYNDPRVKKHFPIRMWICISRNLDITECTKEMIECVSGEKCHNIRNLSVLQNNLLKLLPVSDNIMLVLDDVWYDKEAGEDQWDNLLKPFAFRGAKCKIVVTSRTSWSFPNALQPSKLTELSDLALDDFISLLRYHAIDGLLSNPQLKNDLSDLSDIVDQIAKSMSKSPLAAKVVGNQLRKRPDISFWRATLENVDLSDTKEILMWSFHRFDVQLQRCFLFCSVFPKGSRYSGNLVVPYWVALDFIQPSDDNRTVEDIGLEYFEIMVANSIFHPVDKTHKLYTMHDLFHDLAEKLSVGDCFMVTNAEREIPSTVQHVFLEVDNEILKEKLSGICNLSNLRTLILGNQFIDDISEIFPKISTKKFRNLRGLEVWSMGYKTLPRVLGDFRSLHLLDISRSSIEELPDSILQLYHLQFLFLPSSVKTLPTKLCNLIKLRHIELYDSDGNKVNTLPPVPYLGKLTALQSLDEFHVRKEEGYNLQQLGCLKEIGGSLKIVNLENVRDKEEAIQARLIEKPKLKKLELVWLEPAEINDLEIEVIEALQPPTNLEWLRIDGYRGSTYPTWLQEGFFIENAKGVRFYNCNALTILPPIFHQYRHCSEIVLENLGALRELSTFPECLATLSIIRCPCLILKCENELRVNENQRKMESGFLLVYPDAHALDHELKSFKQTISVENNGEELQILESAVWDNTWDPSQKLNVNRAWWTCHVERMNFIFRCNSRANKLKLPSMLRILHLGYCCISDGALSDCLREMVTLEELYLSGIMTITTLPPIQVLESLKSLRVLEIKKCWYLRQLGGLPIPNLQHFWVQSCWCVNMFRMSLQQLDKFKQFFPTVSGNTPLPPTLQSLNFMCCVVPLAILNSNFPSLQDVEINNCNLIGFLSIRQLTSLKSLVLYNCCGLRVIQGLESRPFINKLMLVRLPDLSVESVLESWQGCRQELSISSLAMLNKLLSTQDFFAPQVLSIHYCEEEKISFEKSDHLQSIKTLAFFNCKTKYLPITLSGFSTLEYIHFKDCPEISMLPKLPRSVQWIRISGCPVLRERCQPNGVDWHKIQCIQDRVIE